jgi:uncharacterized protein YgiM (DUF1202 family)
MFHQMSFMARTDTFPLKSILIFSVLGFMLGAWDRDAPADKGRVVFPAVSRAFAASEPTIAYVTTGDVNVRSGPGIQYRAIAIVKSGTKVNVVGREGEWLKIISRHGNPPGYIMDRFARPLEDDSTATPGTGTYVTTTEVNVRSGPGTQYDVVARIPKDTKVQVVGTEGDWLKVQSKHGNPPGYIFGRYAERY